MHNLGFVSRRYWRTHPTRLLSCLAAVALLVGVSLPAGQSAASALRSYQPGAADPQLDLQLVSTVDEGMQARWQAAVEAVPGVAQVVPSLNRQGVVVHAQTQFPVRVRGVDGGPEVLPEPLRGRALQRLERGTVMVSSALAEALDLDINAQVEVVTPKGFRSYYVVGVFEAGRGPLAYTLVASLGEVQAAFAGGERLVSLFDIGLTQSARRAEVVAALDARMGGVASVPEAGQRSLAGLRGGAGVLVLLILVFTLLASGYLLLTNLSLMVVERRNHVAQLTALGLGPRALRSWLRLELVWLFVLGSVPGLGLAGVLGGVFADMVQNSLLTRDVRVYEVFLSPVALGVSLGMVLGLLGLSFWYVGRQLGSLGQSARLRGRFGYAATLTGALCFGLMSFLPLAARPGYWTLVQGLCLFGLLACLTVLTPQLSALLSGVVSRWQGAPPWLWLSAGLLKRHRQRSGVAVASLILSLSMLTGVYGLTHSYRSSLRAWVDSMYDWDLLVSQRSLGVQTEVPMGEALGWELAVVPGVSLVSADVWPSIRQGRLDANLYVFDMANFPYKRSFTSLEGVSSEALPAALRGGRNVAVSRSLARAQALGVGSGLSLITPTGEYPYDVVAVVDDIGGAVNSIFMDRQTYLNDWRDENVDLFTIALEEKANREQVATLIREQLSSRYDLEVKSVEQYRAELYREVADTFGVSQALVLLFVVIAALGLVNVGLESLYHLRRDFAVLNALGARFGMIRTILLAEVAFNGILGVLAGLTLGSLLSGILVRGVQLSSRFTVVWHLPVTAYGVLALAALLVTGGVSAATLHGARRLKLLGGAGRPT